MKKQIKTFPLIFPQSGSQNDLCDSWAEGEEETDESSSKTSTPVGSSCGGRGRGSFKNLSAEYPFHRNLCMQQQGINFDLTHKRGINIKLFLSLNLYLDHKQNNSLPKIASYWR